MVFQYRGVNNKKTRKAPKANGKAGKFPKKKTPPRHIFGGLAALTWLTAIVLGVVTLVGCISPNTNHLYVADLNVNQTYNVNFRVGFFGGCLSMANATGKPLHTQCVMNMRVKDDNDLSDQLLDDWSVPDAARVELKSALNKTVGLARHLQKDVFPAAPPTTHIVFLLISGIMLFALSTNVSNRRGYKIALVLGVLVGAFALALVYLASIGALGSINAIRDDSWSVKTDGLGGDGVAVQRAGTLWGVQLGQVACVSLFYIFMGMMFVYV